MPIEIIVPRLGWSMEEGTFVGWLKQHGEPVRVGEPLFSLEGEKAIVEVESIDSGILHIPPNAPRPGEAVSVGCVLGYLLEQNEAAPSELRTTPEPALPTTREGPGLPAGQPAAADPLGSEPVAIRAFRPAVAVSPRALRVAAELGVDWTRLAGTGRTGRIRERDVRAAAARQAREQAQAASEAELPGRLLPWNATRRTIARRVVAGVHEAAPVTLTCRADATGLVALRRQFTAAAAGGEPVPTVTDLFVKLAAAALARHPMLNAQWRDDGIFLPGEVNIAIAVETEAGLVAPVIHEVPALTLQQVATASRTLVEQARARRLTARQLQGGTFTVTNLGGLGIDAFTPILNPPQCAVLGVGRVAREPVVVGEAVVQREQVTLSLTFDHRIVDGAPAARFLATLCQLLTNPAPALTK
jgi:pyruvate dehydrogenase E2 component (dihydrolipoamide acetyltransferase)